MVVKKVVTDFSAMQDILNGTLCFSQRNVKERQKKFFLSLNCHFEFEKKTKSLYINGGKSRSSF